MGRSQDKDTKKHGAIYNAVYEVGAALFKLVLRVRVIGLENVPEKGGFIVCANHTSATDPIAICCAMKDQRVRFMAKKELFKIPLLAPLIRMFGAFPVDRGGNDVGAIKKSVEMVKSGVNMGIFPQGHRYPEVDPRQTDTKNGAALISVKANADILPCYIVRKNNKFKLFRRTLVIIGERIPFSLLKYDTEASGEYARITDVIFDRICTLGESYMGKA